MRNLTILLLFFIWNGVRGNDGDARQQRNNEKFMRKITEMTGIYYSFFGLLFRQAATASNNKINARLLMQYHY